MCDTIILEIRFRFPNPYTIDSLSPMCLSILCFAHGRMADTTADTGRQRVPKAHQPRYEPGSPPLISSSSYGSQFSQEVHHFGSICSPFWFTIFVQEVHLFGLQCYECMPEMFKEEEVSEEEDWVQYKSKKTKKKEKRVSFCAQLKQ